jgi:hypothetical protein
VLFTKLYHSNGGDGIVAHIRCYGNVFNKSLHSNEHLQIVLLRDGPDRERSLFLLLLWSVTDVHNMWEVSMEGSHTCLSAGLAGNWCAVTTYSSFSVVH